MEQKTKKLPASPKSKTLFDHINQIRNVKNEHYFDELTDAEKKGFNQYIILMGLSMDKDCIDEVASLYQYISIIPNRHFYKVCCDIFPRSSKFFKWIKNSGEKINTPVCKKIAEYYSVGLREANEYYICMMASESGKLELRNLISKYGLTEKEVDKLLK
jgi:hypothetical protein